MDAKEILLTRRWIIKKEDRDLYYQIKDNAKELRKFFQEKFGYSLIVHQQYIRLDKVPDKAEPWMGITPFKSLEEYQYFCLLLIYLEDKQVEEQFVLSSLIEFIALQLHKDESYWLKYNHRRHFVNVLRYSLNQKLIVQDDGDSDDFMKDGGTEVLFESTGLSRYFMRSFVSDIFEWQKPEDFMQNEWFDEMQERGIARRQRVYRQLLLTNGIYYESEKNQDMFAYIRNFRRRIEKDFESIAPCNLQVYTSSAYLIFDEDHQFGLTFPKSNAMDELTTICISALSKKAKANKKKIDEYEILHIDEITMNKVIMHTIQQNLKNMPATYRQKGCEDNVNMVIERMIEVGFIKKMENEYICFPVIAKLIGEFEEVEG